MTRRGYIEERKGFVRRELLRASHISDGVSTLPDSMENALREFTQCLDELPIKLQTQAWGALHMLLDGARELRDIGALPPDPPKHLWSVRTAMREGAKDINEAARITGLPVYALSFAWDYAKTHPVSIIDEVGALENRT